MAIKDKRFIYDHLVCEFGHWDLCVSGLLLIDGAHHACRLVPEDNETDDPPRYKIWPVTWTEECEEYLTDYRASYAHWFYIDGARPQYDGRDLTWFRTKWERRNPILEGEPV